MNAWSELAKDRQRRQYDARCELDLACTYALRNPALAAGCAGRAVMHGSSATRKQAVALLEALGYPPRYFLPLLRVLASRR